MKQVLDRVLRDMRWRLSAAGSRFEPTRPQWEAWGVRDFPWGLPLLAGCLIPIVLTFALSALSQWFAFAAGYFCVPLALIGAALGFGLRGVLHRQMIFWAYRRQLKASEYFVLAEYTNMLRRQQEISPGNSAFTAGEVQTLRSLAARATELGRELTSRQVLAGLGADIGSGRRPSGGDDRRLPPDVRTRLVGLEKEARQAPQVIAAVQGGAASKGQQ